jgi:hypothetical protein
MEDAMTGRGMLAAVVALALVSMWSCGPPPRTVKWGTGNKGFRSGYTVVYSSIDKSLDSMVFFDAPMEKFAACDPFAKVQQGVYEAYFKMKDTGFEFTVVRYIDTDTGDEIEINGTTYHLSRGPVFLCTIKGGSLSVEQVQANIAAGYVEFYFPEGQVDKLVEQNAAVGAFAQRCEVEEQRREGERRAPREGGE